MHIMDNKCLATVKQYLPINKLELGLFPPNMHKINKSEKAIGTFKDHFITGFTTVPV